MIGKQDQNHSSGKRNRREDGGSPQHRADAQAPLQLFDIGVQMVPSIHGSSRDIVRY